MQPNTQFKINSVEELKQAYENSKNAIYKLKDEIYIFNNISKKLYWTTNEFGESYMSNQLDYRTTIPNPFKNEYPKEMWVWDNFEESAIREKIIAHVKSLEYPYLTNSKYGKDTYHGYKNAKDIEPKPKTIKEKIKELENIIEETQKALKQLKN